MIANANIYCMENLRLSKQQQAPERAGQSTRHAKRAHTKIKSMQRRKYATQRNTNLCNAATPKVKTIAYKHDRTRSHLQEGYTPHVRGSIG